MKGHSEVLIIATVGDIGQIVTQIRNARTVTELLTVMTAVIYFKFHIWSLQERCRQKFTHCEWFLVDRQKQNLP
jgi:hypothetical protein